jgi:hypothetical protein
MPYLVVETESSFSATSGGDTLHGFVDQVGQQRKVLGLLQERMLQGADMNNQGVNVVPSTQQTLACTAVRKQRTS